MISFHQPMSNAKWGRLRTCYPAKVTWSVRLLSGFKFLFYLKMEGSSKPHFDILLGGTERLPVDVEVGGFIDSRIQEIKALTDLVGKLIMYLILNCSVHSCRWSNKPFSNRERMYCSGGGP